MTVEIVYETHSLTIDNENGNATGWLGGSLSENGRRFAAELGARRRNDGISVVFTSDLARAVATAEVAFAESTLEVRADARLRECNYGDLNGNPVELVRPFAAHIDVPYPGGESIRDVVRRMNDFLSDLSEAWQGARLLLIGHAATRWALDHLLGGIPLRDAVEAPFEWREGWEYRLD